MNAGRNIICKPQGCDEKIRFGSLVTSLSLWNTVPSKIMHKSILQTPPQNALINVITYLAPNTAL